MTGAGMALAMVLTVGGAASGATRARGAGMDAAHVWFRMDILDGKLSVWFKRSAPSGCVLSGNYRDRAEIGWYEADWGREPYDALRALKQKVGFDGIPPGPPIQPGMRTVNIGETEDGKKFDMKGWFQGDIPKAVEPLLDEAVRRAEALFAHPRCVVRGSGAAVAAAAGFEVGAPLAFQVKMAAAGAEPLRMGNPLAVRDGGSELKLVVAREVPSPKEEDVLWIDLRPADLHPALPNAPREDDVKLAPGDELEFTVRRKVRAGPGRYRAMLVVYAPYAAGLDRVHGHLRIDLGAFEVHEHSSGGR